MPPPPPPPPPTSPPSSLIADEVFDLSPIHALLQGLIDYAGLFPPAKLDMADAVKHYAGYLRSPHSWMLGRFICPVSRLEEFRNATLGLLPGGGGQQMGSSHASRAMADGDEGLHVVPPDTHPHHADDPWPISAIIDGDLDEDLDAIFAFNREHSLPAKGLATVDAIEIKVPTSSTADAAVFVDEALDLIPEEVYPFFEIPVFTDHGQAPDLRGLVTALSGADAGAKLRTGGVTPETFPSALRVAEFIVACAQADVPFKATAGLHHPIRAEHPLTYEPNCPRGVMHGFLNVFLAAAFVQRHHLDIETTAAILSETNPRAFTFNVRAVSWRKLSVEAADLGIARETFALSFGSCSFTEPVEDLLKLGLIQAGLDLI